MQLNNQDHQYSKTDKILLSDTEEFSHYNNTLDGYISAAGFGDKWIMSDQFWRQWVSGLDSKVLEEIWQLTPEWTFKNWDAAEGIWNEIVCEIKNTKEAKYHEDADKNEEIKISNLEKQLSMILTYIKKRESQSRIIWNFKDWKWDMWNDLKALWISSYIDDLQKFKSNDISNLEWLEVKKFIRWIAKDILSSNLSNNNTSDSQYNDVSELSEKSKKTVESTKKSIGNIEQWEDDFY